MSAFKPLLDGIRRAYDAIEPYEVYYGLKKVKLPRITAQTQDTVRWCLAIQSQGYPITTDLIESLMGLSYGNTLTRLHRLGDNKILTLIRNERGYLRYVVHPNITQYLDPKTITNRVNHASHSHSLDGLDQLDQLDLDQRFEE